MTNEKDLSLVEVKSQVNLIQEVLRGVMKEDEHFGVIPGCKKPTLLKPGAEKLLLLFKLTQRTAVERTNLPNAHVEFSVTVSLNHNDTYVGMGIGICSTMESKYRYRNETLGAVPPTYWSVFKKDKLEASRIIGEGNVVKKQGGSWVISRRIEADNPADFYNTCIKMAKKRALVDAVLTTTASSDLFTQDLDEMTPEELSAIGRPEALELKNSTKFKEDKTTVAKKEILSCENMEELSGLWDGLDKHTKADKDVMGAKNQMKNSFEKETVKTKEEEKDG